MKVLRRAILFDLLQMIDFTEMNDLLPIGASTENMLLSGRKTINATKKRLRRY
ncbi:MAG: hypothetical protein ACI4R5_05850 [Acetatifactor sp.]